MTSKQRVLRACRINQKPVQMDPTTSSEGSSNESDTPVHSIPRPRAKKHRANAPQVIRKHREWQKDISHSTAFDTLGRISTQQQMCALVSEWHNMLRKKGIDNFLVNLVNLMLEMGGFPDGMVDSRLLQNDDVCDLVIQKVDLSGMANVSRYPALEKTRKVSVAQNYMEFTKKLITEGGTDLLVEGLIESMFKTVSQYVDTSFRVLRHVATLVFFGLMEGIVELEDVHTEGPIADSCRRLLEDGQEVIEKRLKDIAPEIRKDAIKSMCRWIRNRKRSMLLMDDVNIISIMNRQEDDDVRGEVMTTVLGEYKRVWDEVDKRTAPKLDRFTRRFTSILMKRLRDPDIRVRLAVVGILDILALHDKIERDDVFKVTETMWRCDNKDVLEALARFTDTHLFGGALCKNETSARNHIELVLQLLADISPVYSENLNNFIRGFWNLAPSIRRLDVYVELLVNREEEEDAPSRVHCLHALRTAIQVGLKVDATEGEVMPEKYKLVVTSLPAIIAISRVSESEKSLFPALLIPRALLDHAELHPSISQNAVKLMEVLKDVFIAQTTDIRCVEVIAECFYILEDTFEVNITKYKKEMINDLHEQIAKSTAWENCFGKLHAFLRVNMIDPFEESISHVPVEIVKCDPQYLWMCILGMTTCASQLINQLTMICDARSEEEDRKKRRKRVVTRDVSEMTQRYEALRERVIETLGEMAGVAELSIVYQALRSYFEIVQHEDTLTVSDPPVMPDIQTVVQLVAKKGLSKTFYEGYHKIIIAASSNEEAYDASIIGDALLFNGRHRTAALDLIYRRAVTEPGLTSKSILEFAVHASRDVATTVSLWNTKISRILLECLGSSCSPLAREARQLLTEAKSLVPCQSVYRLIERTFDAVAGNKNKTAYRVDTLCSQLGKIITVRYMEMDREATITCYRTLLTRSFYCKSGPDRLQALTSVAPFMIMKLKSEEANDMNEFVSNLCADNELQMDALPALLRERLQLKI